MYTYLYTQIEYVKYIMNHSQLTHSTTINVDAFPMSTRHGVHHIHRPSPWRAAQQPGPASQRAPRAVVEVAQGRRPVGGLEAQVKDL